MAEKLLVCLYLATGFAMCFGLLVLCLPLLTSFMNWRLGFVGQKMDDSADKRRKGIITGGIVMVVFYILIASIILTAAPE